MSLADLLRLPDSLEMAAFALVVAGLAAAAPHLGRVLLRLPDDPKREDAAFDGYKLVFSIFGVMLSFLLVQASVTYRGVADGVVKEATTLTKADRALARAGAPEFADLRQRLAAYGARLVDDDWRLQSDGRRSAAADEAFADLSARVRRLEPADERGRALQGEAMRSLDDLEDLREIRLAASSGSLPAPLWAAVAGLILVELALASLAGRSVNRSFALAASGAAIGLMVSLIVIVDRPFVGEFSAGAAPIQRALDASAHRG